MTVVWSGLSLGAVYALVAYGLNHVYSATGVVNFAMGQIVVLGSFVAYWGRNQYDLPWVAVIGLAGIVGLVFAFVEERLAIRPIAGSSAHGELVTTVGFASILTGIIALTWGTDPLRINFPSEPMTLLGGRLLPIDSVLILVALAFGIALPIWGRLTLTGLAGLAVSENREAAMLRGIRIRRLSITAFVLAGAFSGVIGCLVGAKTYAYSALGGIFVLKGFVAATLGGFGSQVGALIGGFAVGLIEAVAGRYLGASYQNLTTFVLLVIVLLVRPSGLFGIRAERLV